MKGIDISHWQKGLSMNIVKQSGYDFVICKAGGHESGIYYKDECFKNFVTDAISIGLKLGAYFYSTAKSIEDAKNEADYFNSILCDYTQCFEFPVFIDYEDSTCLKDSDSVLYVNEFVRSIEKHGYSAGLYASAYVHNNQLAKYKYGNRWVAHWGIGENKVYADSGIHQYTNREYVGGYMVDADITNIDYPQLIKQNNRNGFSNCDTNADGKVNSKDIVHTIKHVAENKSYDVAQDVNKDGKVNSKDITKIMKEVSK